MTDIIAILAESDLDRLLACLIFLIWGISGQRSFRRWSRMWLILIQR